MENKQVNLFGIRFDSISMDKTLVMLEKIVNTNKVNGNSEYVVTPNVDHLVNISKDKKFKEIYNNARLRLVDGMPIVLLSKLLGKPLEEKISGADLTPVIIDLAYKQKYKIFIFGSKAGVAKKVVDKYKVKYGNDFNIDCYSPPFGFEKNEIELNKSINKIKDFSPDILLVSLGSPKGEYFIYDNLEAISAPLNIQIGAAIDFIAGTVKRAPNWMQKCGLEWLYRFIKEPRRMFKRYFINDLYFLKLIMLEIKSLKKSGDTD